MSKELVSTSDHPFVAGSTQAAKEPVDHLNGAQDQLQTAGGQQGRKQPNVELHDVLRLGAHSPPGFVTQVILITAFKWCVPDQQNFAQRSILQPGRCHYYAVQSASHSYCSECNRQEHPTAIPTAALFSS